MPHYHLALLGFGNVGQALARLLLRKADELRSLYDLTFDVTGIATGRHGSALNPNGIELERALQLMEAGERLDSLSTQPVPVNAFDFIRRSQAQVLFENTPVNYESGQPAVDHLKQALELGMHAITANKGPVVHAYSELRELARSRGVRFYFESTVMDGAPIFSLFRETLPAAHLRSFRGILNSTTNMILTRMEQGETFEQAVAYCQEIGLAETDPSGDVDGWDAAVKVAALSTVLMGVNLKPQEVEREGIRRITPEDIRAARAENKRWKLVCTAERQGQGVRACVAPQLVDAASPLFGVEGSTSIVQFETDVLGLLTVIEADPGPDTTAYGLFADFLNAVRSV
ncbi:MAG: homoserine dehydrogenase [Chloroflexi bacterium]|jgi:homoserine dehydrogenase|nr:homoserine dehydrogenase [Chloroflexota bacterium]